MNKIDQIDRAIIDLLMQDGRMPAAEIARNLGGGISERMVRYRIQRLTSAGVISINAIANRQALGYSVVADVFIEVETSQISHGGRAACPGRMRQLRGLLDRRPRRQHPGCRSQQ